jgi:flagellar biosynthesis protein FlhA
MGENIETFITKSLQNQKDSVQTLGLSPVILKELNKGLANNLEKFKLLGYPPIVITSATIRPYFYRLINSSFPDFSIISYSELPSQIEIEFIDRLEVLNAN